MEKFKNVTCGIIIPIFLLIIIPYIKGYLQVVNYMDHYISQSAMSGKYIQEIFIYPLWGILMGIYLLWLNRSSDRMVIFSTIIMILALAFGISVLAKGRAFEFIAISHDLIFIWSSLVGVLGCIWIYRVRIR